MEKLFDKVLSFRGDEWRPFAIEVSQDEIRLAVYGGAGGFAEPATAETAPHDDLADCLLEGIALLEQSRLLSPSRVPYHRMPHHRCVFFKSLQSPQRGAEVCRRKLMRSVPRPGDHVNFSARVHDPIHEVLVKDVYWQLGDDEVHLWLPPRQLQDEEQFETLMSSHLENGWEIHREFKWPQ